jgi:hypothetical protein
MTLIRGGASYRRPALSLRPMRASTLGGYPRRMGAYPYYVTYAPMIPGAPGQGLAGRPRRLRGYPYSTVYTVPGQGLAGRIRRLGQDSGLDYGSELESLFTPTAGGGSATTSAGTVYVNSQGEDQSTPDPNAGQSGIGANLAAYGGSVLSGTLGTVAPYVVVVVGILALLAVKK